jgi:hypothetical protein
LVSGQKDGDHIFIGLFAFLYAIFVPNIVHSFWDEFANLFGRKANSGRGERQ